MPVAYIIALHVFTMTNVHATRTLLTLYAINLGAEPIIIGLLAAAFGLIPILFSWVSGRLADRFGSRWIMLFGIAVCAIGMLLPAFIPSVTVIIIAGVLSGTSTTFCTVSLQTLVGLLSKQETRARNYANFSLAGAVTNFLGPMIAGFSIDLAGYHNTCLLMVGIALIPLLMLLLKGQGLPAGSGHAAPAGSLRETLAVPGVWRALAASAIGQTGGDLLQFYMPVHAHAAGLSASMIGIVLAAFAAAQFVARLALAPLVARSNEETVLAYGFAVGAVAFVLAPMTGTAATIGMVSFLLGLGLGCARPISMMLMFAHSTGGRSGEAMGLRLTAENLTRLAAPLLFGMVASTAGLAVAFWLNAVMLGSGGAYMRHGSTTRRSRP